MDTAFEINLWTELLAFEKNDPDRGAARYINSIPRKPDAVFLFVCAADFPFSHKGMEYEYELSPAICSRNAHPRNEQRERQKWTNYDLRALIANLKELGVKTMLSMFTGTYRDKHGPEYLTQHPELTVYRPGSGSWGINPIAELNDGTPCEKIFASGVGRLIEDYGFAGFHGADAWNSSGMLYRGVGNDNIIRQFLRRTGLEAPDYVSRECGWDPVLRKKRMSWVWGKHRQEFSAFIRTRWKEFWKEVADNVHAKGGECYMNSAYTRGSHVAAAWLGIDYKEIAEAGMDAIVCETVPLSMTNQAMTDAWESWPELHRHYHAWCLTHMMEIRAYLPDTRVLFLHGCKDVVENWDNIRQSPTGYERELFALSSLCHYRNGKLYRAADGLAACLADGFSAGDWEFITKRWDSAIRDDELVSAGDMVFVWDDKMVSEGVEDYFYDYFPTAFDTIFKFKYHGFAVQSTARADELEGIDEILIVPVAHLLGEEKIKEIISRRTPAVLIGRTEFLAPFAEGAVSFNDSRCTILIVNSGLEPQDKFYWPKGEIPAVNESGRNFMEVNTFTTVMPQMGVPAQQWQDAFAAVEEMLAIWKKNSCRLEVSLADADNECQLLTRRYTGGRLETILENRVQRNIRKTLQFNAPYRDFKITSMFPFYPNAVREDSMIICSSANRGMCAVEVVAENVK